jgi:hypothetical protein
MKASTQFEKSISSYLELRAIEDTLFAETLKKPNKSLSECVNYIMQTVQKSGINGFEDDEIFGMAVHYYDEDDIKDIKSVNAKVIVNHTVKLTQADLDVAKNIAMERAVEDAKKNIKIDYVPELNEEEMTEAKQRAMDKAVADILSKKTVKKTITPTEPAQGSLF